MAAIFVFRKIMNFIGSASRWVYIGFGCLRAQWKHPFLSTIENEVLAAILDFTFSKMAAKKHVSTLSLQPLYILGVCYMGSGNFMGYEIFRSAAIFVYFPIWP